MTRGSDGLPNPGECPRAERIAAHAERRLAGEEAARMDEHLASCPTCHEVFAETLRFALDEEEVEPAPARDSSDVRLGQRMAGPPGSPPGRLRALGTIVRRPGLRVAASLAVAAALVLLVARFALFEGRPAPTPRPLVAELAHALGTERFVEPRLTGGFEHGRLVVLRSGEAPRGLDAFPPAVLAAVAGIRERAESDPSPQALGALGITYIVSGDVGAAVKALESATKQAPADARLLSDLSAAYLVRASRLDEAADLPKALEAAEKAITLEGAPDEAWFNRALALESLHLVDAARKAWDDYLERDAASGWADEARQHLETLRASKQTSLLEDRARARAALEEGPGAVERLAQEAPSVLRDYFEAELLPAWAEAQLVGRPDAPVLREHAREVGDALLRSTGDALPRDTARALEVAPRAASRDPPRSQALGYRAFREALRLYDLQQPSCPSFREALRLLEEGDSPYASRAREWVIHACLLLERPRAALAELRMLEGVAGERGDLHVLARVHWLEGLVVGRREDLAASLERYRLARGEFHRLGDTESVAALCALIAENLRELGESRQAWRERRAGLALLDEIRSPRGRHRTLDEAYLACQGGGFLRSALHFASPILEGERRWQSALALGDGLVTRAVILHALGSDERARSDLAQARQMIARIGDRSQREFMAAVADEAEGSIVAAEQPEVAVAAYRRALAYFERAAPSQIPRLRLLIARALSAQGRSVEADEQLRAGIERLERERLFLRDGPLQTAFFDDNAALFDEMVRVQIDGRNDPERALLFLERGRARQLADALDGPPATAGTKSRFAQTLVTPLEPEALRRELPPGVALVYYASLPDRLLSWVLTRDESRFVERPLPADTLGRMVATYQAAIDVRAPLPAVHEQSARLYDELVRPLGAALRSQRALILIRDGALQSIAFASLWDRESGRYLVEDHVLGHAPSGTVFVRTARAAADPGRNRGPSALVVGNPRLDREAWAEMPSLPGAEAEAEDVARLYAQGELLTGAQATRAAFLERLPASTIVHFAGHAVSDEAPWTGRLLFAPDPARGDSGALSLSGLDGEEFPHTRLVVLGACRTAAGAVSPLEGSLSLARPFLSAGVPTVVASLWDLDDAISRDLLVDFHRRLQTEGDPLLALRQTQVDQIRQPDPVRAHPASWAGLVGVGGLDARVWARPPPPHEHEPL